GVANFCMSCSLSSGGLPVGPLFLMKEKLRCVRVSGNEFVAQKHGRCRSEPRIHCNDPEWNATTTALLIAMNWE
ncbi:hypothetical protein, partial [Streptomyces wedmorensis]|uniref:hypothetical protein n=1 Tax=Streptomyces wedmorensis TaxID=43759 RepID=UPI001AE07687